MRIRTQFIITVLLFGIVLAVIAASAIVTNQQVEEANQQERIAGDLAQGASELSYLSNDYLIYGEGQQLKRWQSRFASFSARVADLRGEGAEQQALVANIQANQNRFKEVFDSAASALELSSGHQRPALYPAFLQVSWSRMAVQSQGLVSDASRLSQLLRRQMDQLTRRRTLLIYVMVSLLGAFLLAGYMLTYQRVLKSVAALQAHAAVIGSGNLDLMTEEKRKDEIGDLSRAFDRMAVNLKAVTASKSDLEKEIAERKLAEEELRWHREWLRVTLSSIGDAVIATDTAGRITFLNPVAEGLTGWKETEALDQPIRNVLRTVNEETRIPTEDIVGRVLREGNIINMANHTILVALDGREIPIEDSAAPIKDGAGHLTGVVLVFHDITERTRTQEKLAEAHERAVWLARFPGENPAPVARVSAEGRLLYGNPAMAKLAGWTCETGKPLPDPLLPLAGRAMAEGREVEEEVELGGRFYNVCVAPIVSEGYANVYGRDITDRKRAEEALRVSEARYRTLFMSITEGFYLSRILYDGNGGPVDYMYEEVNPAFERLMGLSRDEIVGRRARDLFPSLSSRWLGIFSKVARSGVPSSDTFYSQSFGRYFETLAFRPTDGQFAVLVTDVTERKKAEEAVEEARRALEREKDLLQSVMDGARNSHLVYLDRDFKFVCVNEAYARTCGYTPAEMVGKNHFALYPHEENEAIFGRARDEGVSVEFHDKPFVFPDQPERGITYWDWTLNPVKDEDGAVEGLVFSLVETTERKRAELALRESEMFLKETQRIARVGGWKANPETDFLEWTEGVYPIIEAPQDYKPGFAEGAKFYLPQYIPVLRDRILHTLAGGEPFVEECELLTAEGKKVWAEVRGLAHSHEGKADYVVGTFQDITERKAAEEALRQRSDELRRMAEVLERRVQERTADLESANETLRNLSARLLSAQEDERKRIAGDLHDTIGACLSGIRFKVERGLHQLGETASVATESLNTIIPVIQEGIEECRRMQQDLRPSILDDLGLLATLSWFCRRFETLYSHIRTEREIDVGEREIPDALKIVIYRITQEAMNNAAKHSGADVIRLSLVKREGRMELAIEDNGRGVDPRRALDSERSRRGLGLTSMRERTELSGGSFALESAEGKGTTVRAWWPLREAG